MLAELMSSFQPPCLAYNKAQPMTRGYLPAYEAEPLVLTLNYEKVNSTRLINKGLMNTIDFQIYLVLMVGMWAIVWICIFQLFYSSPNCKLCK